MSNIGKNSVRVGKYLNLQRGGLSHWAKIPLAPADKILGLNEEFAKNTSPTKVNLGVGAYRDDKGKPYILPSVRAARVKLEAKNPDHEYAGIAGLAPFVKHSLEFAYGEGATVLKEGRVAAVQTLSGTGACRLVGEFIARFMGKGKDMYMPDPTWGNHIPIMKNSGLEVPKYRYFDPKTKGFNFEGMLADVLSVKGGSAFLVHACAHNPTGCDPTRKQWDELSQAFLSKKHIVFFDSAYQGFASGDSEVDAYSIRKFVSDGNQIILGQSYAKNFGLYGERVGALSVVTSSPEETERVNSQLKLLVRPMYSNPPIYGARIVQEILSDPVLKKQWAVECKGMADRIISMRHALRSELEKLGSKVPWGHITDQIGMFAFTGLTEAQVLQMRREHNVYCTDDGRISIAGLTSGNVGLVAAAMHAVTK